MGKHSKSNPKTCLISLPAPFEEVPNMDVPLGLGYISSFLKANGKDVSLVDLSNEKDYLNKIPKADIYGVSITTPQFYWFKQIASQLDGVVVAGGPHASSRPNECLEAKADIAVIGEGEQIMLDIVNGKKYNGHRGIIKNLDSLPFPDRPNKVYKRTINGEKAVHIISARDCPYSCSFCSKKSVGTNVRFRSIQNFLAEIDEHRANGINSFVIYDDTFTFKKDRAIKIAKELGKRDSTFRFFSRTDKLDYEMMNTFKKNGLSSATLGIETFSQDMLNIYNKKNSVENNKKVLNLCKELDIPVRCSLIYGGPYETKKTLTDTIKGVEETQPSEWNVATFVPIPGSDIGDNPDKYDIVVHENKDYLKYNRVGESGFGEVLVDISTMSPDEYKSNRKWFVEELERVCPRKNIQDSIQTLKV